MIVRPASKPRFDLGRLVGGVVVHDDMGSEPLRNLSVDLFEELQELDRPMALVAFANDKPGSDIERSKKRGRAVPNVAVRATFGYARHHRQDRLLAIECLYLTLFINAEDNGSVRWGQVKPDNIAHLVDE